MRHRFGEFFTALNLMVKEEADVKRENYIALLKVYGIGLKELGLRVAVREDEYGEVIEEYQAYFFKLTKMIAGSMLNVVAVIDKDLLDLAPNKEQFIWSELTPWVDSLLSEEDAYYDYLEHQEMMFMQRKGMCLAHSPTDKGTMFLGVKNLLKQHRPDAPCICWKGRTLDDQMRVQTILKTQGGTLH